MASKLANPNLVLRAYRGPEDHPAMNAVANAVRAFNGDAELGTVADMDNHYAHLEHADLPRDCVLVEIGDKVVAYGRASWNALANGEGQVDGILNIDPAHRGIGIEELLVDHAIRRATEIIAARGQVVRTRIILFVTGNDGDQRRVAEGRGFGIVRSFAQLVRPSLDHIPEVALPPGFEIRPIDPHDPAMHRRVFDADARAFADSYGQQAPSDAEFDEFIHMPTFDPTLWRVAFHGEEIAGQVLSYMGEAPAPDGSLIGWTEAISVQPEFRRRGLARALLVASLRAVRDAGATAAGLGVDLQNPNQARALYESLGFRIVSVVHEYEAGPFEPGSVPDLPTAAPR